jgi:hypothetical protein
MSEKIDKSTSGYNGLILTLVFFAVMVFWTLLFLFVIPELQKKLFIKGSPEFIELQSGYSFFTIFGYFCFTLLVVTILAYLLTPGYKNTKGIGIFISVLLFFSLLAVAESLFGYSYITKDGAVSRYFISTGEKRYTWNDVKKIRLSFYNTSAKPKGVKSERMIKAVIIFTEDEIVVREGAGGDFPVLKSVLNNMKNRPEFDIDENEISEWEAIYQDLLKKSLRISDSVKPAGSTGFLFPDSPHRPDL